MTDDEVMRDDEAVSWALLARLRAIAAGEVDQTPDRGAWRGSGSAARRTLRRVRLHRDDD